MQNIKRKPPWNYDKDKHCRVCLQEFIEGRRKQLKKSQAELGDVVGLTQQTFAYRLKKGTFDHMQLVKIFQELNATDAEILRLMKQE